MRNMLWKNPNKFLWVTIDIGRGQSPESQADRYSPMSVVHGLLS